MSTFFQSRRNLLHRTASAVGLLLAFSLAGCATTGQGERGKTEQALLQRANAYWAAIQDNDRVTAWNYEEISTNPEATLQAYLSRSGIVYDEIQVQNVQAIEGDRAKVKVTMVYSVPVVRVKNATMELQDEWVWIGKQWYHAHRPAFQ